MENPDGTKLEGIFDFASGQIKGNVCSASPLFLSVGYNNRTTKINRIHKAPVVGGKIDAADSGDRGTV